MVVIVVTIPMSAGIPADRETPAAPALPIIPTAAIVNKEGNSGWYSAYFAPVSKLWIMLYELSWAPGTFLADPNDGSLLRALPDGSSWDERLWRLWRVEEAADSKAVGRVVELSTVPTRDATASKPWAMDGQLVTRAIPVMRSRCGHVRSVVLAER